MEVINDELESCDYDNRESVSHAVLHESEKNSANKRLNLNRSEGTAKRCLRSFFSQKNPIL